MKSTGCAVVEIETSDGAVGQGFVFTLNGDRIRSFEQMIRGFAPLVEGRGVHETSAISTSIWDAINPTGHAGVTIAALSAIDMACWDA
ncbi:MAG: L-alanine-DL-glutamate epimerase-like enolase superfamily enzyme [Candidatus Poriferisodalaceae bacterium]|jgi:L-alanine-DL-glutamate epimerase-like enolase superfamily enzyme